MVRLTVCGMVLSALLMSFGLAYGQSAPAAAPEAESDALVGKPAKFTDNVFYVYTDYRNRENHFIPSGWMGDYGDVKMHENWKENPKSGTTCLKFSYSAAAKQGANWAGIYWQNPANNWGAVKGGFDLRQAKKLTFWARGGKGDERIMEFKVGGIDGNYADSGSAGIGPVDLSAQWEKYEIDLRDTDLSYISGGFCWVTSADANPEGCEFYIDDIRFE